MGGRSWSLQLIVIAHAVLQLEEASSLINCYCHFYYALQILWLFGWLVRVHRKVRLQYFYATHLLSFVSLSVLVCPMSIKQSSHTH